MWDGRDPNSPGRLCLEVQPKRQRGKTKNLRERMDQDARTARIISALKTWICPLVLPFSKDNTACVHLPRYYIHFIISYIKLLLCWLHTRCMIRLGSESYCRWEQRREAERKRMVGSHRLVLASWHPNSDWPVRRPAGVGNESMSSWIVSLNSSHNVIFAVLGFCLWSQKNICDWEIRAEIL